MKQASCNKSAGEQSSAKSSTIASSSFSKIVGGVQLHPHQQQLVGSATYNKA